MLHYFYHEDYQAKNFTSAKNVLVLHIKVSIIADKYLVDALCALVQGKLEADSAGLWRTYAFAVAISTAYDAASPSMHKVREILVNQTVKHSSGLFLPWNKNAMFQETARETPEFAASVAAGLAQGVDTVAAELAAAKAYLVEPRSYYCKECRQNFVAAIPKGHKHIHLCAKGYGGYPLWRRTGTAAQWATGVGIETR
jgi:hypothetical protein